MKIPNQLKSRKLWLALIGAFVAFGNGMWDWGLTSEEVFQILGPLIAYIGVEGARDLFQESKK